MKKAAETRWWVPPDLGRDERSFPYAIGFRSEIDRRAEFEQASTHHFRGQPVGRTIGEILACDRGPVEQIVEVSLSQNPRLLAQGHPLREAEVDLRRAVLEEGRRLGHRHELKRRAPDGHGATRR